MTSAISSKECIVNVIPLLDGAETPMIGFVLVRSINPIDGIKLLLVLQVGPVLLGAL